MMNTIPNAELKAEWINEDLTHLVQIGLDEQLQTIFGKDKAEQFLNPTIQDKPQQGIVQQITKKSGVTGAHSLWYNLRSNSRKKLTRNAMTNFDKDYSFATKSDHCVLDKIAEYKHRLELMHRVAYSNQSKTRQLISRVKLPKITGDLALRSGPSQYYTQTKVNLYGIL